MDVDDLSDRECLVWTKNKGPLHEDDRQLGPGLRATTPHPFRKSVIHVEGYEEESDCEDTTDSYAPLVDQRDNMRKTDAHEDKDGKMRGEGIFSIENQGNGLTKTLGFWERLRCNG